MQINAFFDDRTSTMTYVVYDAQSRDAVVIDPVLDYDPVGSKIWSASVDAVVSFVEREALNLHLILETHAHADHLSGSQLLKEQFPAAKTCIGTRITEVQTLFKTVFDLPDDFPTDGRQFDRLLQKNERVTAGTLSFKTLFTPGHTPACTSFLFGDVVFTGDTLFMPDQGTGRCDFPAGSAHDLYQSVTTQLYVLPDDTRVFVGHDYQPGDRALAYETTLLSQKRDNVQLREGISEADFVAARHARDKSLAAPQLLFQSVQVNIDAGNLPCPGANETRYLRIPLNVFRPPKDTGELELRDVTDA